MAPVRQWRFRVCGCSHLVPPVPGRQKEHNRVKDSSQLFSCYDLLVTNILLFMFHWQELCLWPILEAKEQLGTVTPAATSASSDNFMLWEEVYEFSCPVSHPVARYNLFAFFFPKEIFLPISKGDNPVSHPVSTCSVKSRPQYCLWAVFRKLWPNRQVLCASLTPAKMWNRCTITATQTPVRKELNNGRQTASALHGT